MSSAPCEFAAGLIDGDGEVVIDPYHSSRAVQALPRVRVSQSYDAGEAPELLWLQKFYGDGCISSRGEPKKSTHRRQWRIQFCDKDSVKRVLSDMTEHCVLKSPQARIALDYLADRSAHAKNYGALREAKRNYAAAVVDSDLLTWPYLAGLFAAEGSVSVSVSGQGYYRLQSSISQSGSTKLLQAIRDKLGFGSVRSDKVEFCGDQTIRFCQGILPYLQGQKKIQVEIALQFQAEKPRRGTKWQREDTERAENKMRELKRLKRM